MPQYLSHINMNATPPATTIASSTVVASGGGNAVYGTGVPLTLVNYGLVEAQGTVVINNMHPMGYVTGNLAATGAGLGVFLSAGGSVTNKYGASVLGEPAGVDIRGGAGTVVNFGTITATGRTTEAAGYGVQLQSGGTVINGQYSAFNGYVIAGNKAGVYIAGGAATIVNRGLIEATNNVGIGVYLGAGAAGGAVNNQGSIVGTKAGIYLNPQLAGGFTITNFGLIAGANGVAIQLAGSNNLLVEEPGASLGGAIDDFQVGDAIDLVGVTATGKSYAGGVLTLTGSTGSQVAQLRVSTPYADPGFALSSDGHNGTLITVATSQHLPNVFSGSYPNGIVLSNPAQNPATVTATADVECAGVAVYAMPGFAWNVTNYGRIVGTNAYGSGISLSAGTMTNAGGGLVAGDYFGAYLGAGVDVVNHGTVAGTGAYGVGIAGYTGSTFVNAGVVIGYGGYAMEFGSGNLLVMDPGAVFVGNVYSPGGNTLELAAGATAGTLTGLGSKYLGFDTVTLDPGAVWHVSGPVPAGQRLTFADATATLALDRPKGFAGTIVGFRAGDTIDLVGMTATRLGFAKGKLNLFNGGRKIASLALSGRHTAGQFALAPDGNGGTDIIFRSAVRPAASPAAGSAPTADWQHLDAAPDILSTRS